MRKVTKGEVDDPGMKRFQIKVQVLSVSQRVLSMLYPLFPPSGGLWISCDNSEDDSRTRRINLAKE